MYRTVTGKIVDTHLLGNKGFQDLIDKGWYCKITKSANETEQDLYDRMINIGYKKVRIWKKATKIAGYHDIIAMVKI